MPGRRKEIKRHLTEQELDEAIDEAQSNGEPYLVRRLMCLKDLYAGDTLAEAADRAGVDTSTVGDWSDAWNEAGVDGLRPEFDGGPKPKLTPSEETRFKQLLREGEPWTYAQIQELLAEEFDVEYSKGHLRRKLEEYGMSYGKPRPTEYRRPDDAEEQLSESLDEAVESIQEENDETATDSSGQDDRDLAPDGGEVTVGFLDETYPKPTDIYHRVWSFGTPEIPVTIDRFDANTFGFYALNGESAVAIKDRSRADEICEFIRTIRTKNPAGPIILVLDQYSSHIANDVKELADELGIELVYLPPKSPDLNPIEKLIGKLKYELSRVFVTEESAFQTRICEIFEQLADRLSFAESWMERFLDITSLQKLR
jgi:transposase